MPTKRRTVIGQLSLLLMSTLAGQAQPMHSQHETLEGAWNVTVASQGFTLCTAPAVFSREGSVIADPCSGSALGVGYGSWVRTGNRELAGTFIGNVYNPATGQIGGRYKVRSIGRLQPDGVTFTGIFKTETFDANGHLLSTVTGTALGRRVLVEPLQ